MATKLYHEMTPAERLADRIARNREIQDRVNAAAKSPEKKPAQRAARQGAGKSALDEFQRIKRNEGIDAASEFVRSRQK